MRREAKFGLVFRSWVKRSKMQNSAFELKQTQTNSLPFSSVKDHQINSLLAVKHGPAGFIWKIADDSIGIKCFDYFYFKNALAFVVIKYPDFFCLIDIDAFISERDSSKRKSLTSERAKEIASHLSTPPERKVGVVE